MTDPKLRLVHPTLVHRVTLLLADPALDGRYGVVSGARTKQQQQALYDRYRAGRGNLAANPNRVVPVRDGWPYSWKPTGSFHMVQFDGFGHAVDLKRPWNHSRSRARKLVHPLLPKYGLAATVASEWWHVQALTSSGWVDGPLPESNDDRTPDMETLIDDTTGEAWVAANGRARPLSDVDTWLSSWVGPTRRSRNMRHVIGDLYDITP